VKVRARHNPEDGATILVISDSGVGIAPDDLPIVMEPYGQVKSEQKQHHKGTGLGLPLTKNFVEALGGELELRSKVGVGTTVTLRFPPDLVVPNGPAGQLSA
jgi:signal transduction histidine kinase